MVPYPIDPIGYPFTHYTYYTTIPPFSPICFLNLVDSGLYPLGSTPSTTSEYPNPIKRPSKGKTLREQKSPIFIGRFQFKLYESAEFSWISDLEEKLFKEEEVNGPERSEGWVIVKEEGRSEATDRLVDK